MRAFVRYNSRNDFGRLERVDPEILNEVDVYTGDLTNPEAVALATEGCDVVFISARSSRSRTPQASAGVRGANVEGTINVLEAARRVDVHRVVQVSSSEVYGTAQIVPIPETHPLRPQSPYAATKVGADQLALLVLALLRHAGRARSPIQYLWAAAVGPGRDPDSDHAGPRTATIESARRARRATSCSSRTRRARWLAAPRSTESRARRSISERARSTRSPSSSPGFSASSGSKCPSSLRRTVPAGQQRGRASRVRRHSSQRTARLELRGRSGRGPCTNHRMDSFEPGPVQAQPVQRVGDDDRFSVADRTR